MVGCARLWFPELICNSSAEESSLALVGWVNVEQKSIDLVIAAAFPVAQFSNAVIRQLQEVLDAAETKLPLALRTERKLRVIGEYVVRSDQISRKDREGREDGGGADEDCGRMRDGDDLGSETSIMTTSGAGMRGESYQTVEISNVWAVVSAQKSRGNRNELQWIPYLRSLSLEGCPSFVEDHIVIYKQPVFGSHHFSCSPWTPYYEVSSQSSSGQKQKTFIKRPQWLTALEQREAADLGMVMLELNCSTYVDRVLKDLWPPAGFSKKRSIMLSMYSPSLTSYHSTIGFQISLAPGSVCPVTEGVRCLDDVLPSANSSESRTWLMSYFHRYSLVLLLNKLILVFPLTKIVCDYSCFDYLCSPIAAVMAIWATILYALARVLALVTAVWLPALPCFGSLLQRSMTWQAIHIRCQQLMAWPFVLLWGGLGPEQPNVAIAHQLATVRYSTFSVLLIDKMIGAITGFFLLKHCDLITKLLIENGQMLTNEVLRIGCIWLMGVPAGFKLNNELAAAIGTMSLHVLQSWSTLLYTLIPVIKIFLYFLGISSFVLGFTVPAAMISDTIFLSTLHISCLHHTVAFLHTNQLRALASLWRLFRGRKRNPLRRRLDTFECSVERLVVASLMFTPLLLLLPTTSVYYTFFSMIFLTLSSVQVMLHYVVAIFHSFPFSLVAAWIIRPKQFPSGVWFVLPKPELIGKTNQGALLSTLGIQPASLGELLRPFLKSLWVMPEWSSTASFVYKVVSGERYHLKLQLGHMAALPHSPLGLLGFARLSYTAMMRASRSE